MPIFSESSFGIAKEPTFGTLTNPTIFMPVNTVTFNGNQKVTRPAQARATRSQVTDPVTGYELDITVAGELIPDAASTLLAQCFGSGSDGYVSAGGVATHTLALQPQLASLTAEWDMDVISGERILARQGAGCVVDQFQLKGTNQSIVTWQAMLLGQRETTPATPGAPSNANPSFFNTIQPMDFSLLACTYKGTNSTQLLDVTLNLANNVQRVFSSNAHLYVARLVPTKRDVTLTTLLDFLDTTYYNDWFNGTKTSGFVFTITSLSNIPTTAVPYSWTFTIPGTRPSGTYAPAPASDVLQQNVTWSVTTSGTNNELSAVIQNDEAGALA